MYGIIIATVVAGAAILIKEERNKRIVAVIHYGRSYWRFVDIPHIFAHTTSRILPRILRKYRRKNAGLEPEPAEKHHDRQSFTSKRMPEPPRFREEPPQEPQLKPDKKDGWVGKDDFK